MLRRAAVLVGSMSTMVIAAAGTTYADGLWGNVDCSQTSYAGCQLGVGKHPPSQRPDQPNPPEAGTSQGSQQDAGAGSSGSSSDSTSRPARGDRIVGGVDPNRAHCRYVPTDYHRPPGGVVPAGYHEMPTEGAVTVRPAVYRPASAAARFAQQPPEQSGAWYVYKCSGEGWEDPLYRPPVWIANGQTSSPAPSPQQVAQQAYGQLRLPSLKIHANPKGAQLVHLPTWLWLESDQWKPQSATASLQGVSVTATATPRSVTWSMGDGTTLTCPGPGAPFPEGTDPMKQSPDCGHTYRRSSLGQPGNSYEVSATVHWSVDWSGAGDSGTFEDLTTTSTTSFDVAESQALNTN